MDKIKVDFNDCTFGEMSPKSEIQYKGKAYASVNLPVFYEDGTCEWFEIADKELENAMIRESGSAADINNDTDDKIDFYCDSRDGLYAALEEITGCEIVGTVDEGNTDRKNIEGVIYCLTVSSSAFTTDVEIFYSEDDAKDYQNRLFDEMRVKSDEREELCHGCFKGYSPRHSAFVEIAIHEKNVFPRRIDTAD